MSDCSSPTASVDREWLSFEHNWLDARVAAAFVNTVLGAVDSASEELTTYRLECDDHLSRARQRMFSPLARLDARILAAEQREWSVHAQDLRQAARTAQLALRSRGQATLAAFEVLRRAMRRHWADERRLLEIAEGLHDGVLNAPAAAMSSVG